MPKIIVAMLGMLAVNTAQAAFTGTSELGYVMTRGNADTETANAKLDLGFEMSQWRHSFGVGGLYGRSSIGTTASRWDTRWQTDRQFDAGAYYWFAAARYENDQYSGFDFQSTLSVGSGHDFFNSDETKLHGQLGVGYRLLRPEQLVFTPDGALLDRIKGDNTTDVIANGALNFEHALNDSTKVLNTLSVESGHNNTLTRNDVALQVKMSKLLAVSLGLSLRNNSNPPPMLERMDTLTTLNLVYARGNKP